MRKPGGVQGGGSPPDVFRAAGPRSAPHGTVAQSADGGLTLERNGVAPTSVALDGGALSPEDGTLVTLLGVRRRPAGVGPFRDGAPQWRARRAWLGSPGELSRSLRHRAARWALWAAVSGLGVLVALDAT